jgi:hypothetical protein
MLDTRSSISLWTEGIKEDRNGFSTLLADSFCTVSTGHLFPSPSG